VASVVIAVFVVYAALFDQSLQSDPLAIFMAVSISGLHVLFAGLTALMYFWNSRARTPWSAILTMACAVIELMVVFACSATLIF